VYVTVDEKERKNGNDPEKELKDNGFQDYQRPYVRSSQLTSQFNLNLLKFVVVCRPKFS